jgi:hypothetical protein
VKIQTVRECIYYYDVNEQTKQKIRHLRQNLARAASRYIPEYIDITLDQLYEIGEKQGWCDLFTGDNLEFTRGGNYGTLNNKGTGACNPLSCSIDRIDSSKGYVYDNVQLVTAKTNFSKGNMSNEEYIEQCRKVIKKYGLI